MPVVRDEEPVSEGVEVRLAVSAALPCRLAWEDDGGDIFTRYLAGG